MAARRVYDRLEHMLAAAVAIERLTAGMTLDDYAADPDTLKLNHPTVDWRGVADIGNVLRHAYDQIIDHRIWQIVATDLAPLKEAVEAMIRDFDQAPDD